MLCIEHDQIIHFASFSPFSYELFVYQHRIQNKNKNIANAYVTLRKSTEPTLHTNCHVTALIHWLSVTHNNSGRVTRQEKENSMQISLMGGACANTRFRSELRRSHDKQKFKTMTLYLFWSFMVTCEKIFITIRLDRFIFTL